MDPVATIPEELRRFVLLSVPSVPFVEAMLVFREQAGTPVAIELLARRLYIPEREALEIVQQLRAARIIRESVQGAGQVYDPDQELAQMLELLARHYRTHLVEVTSLIHSRTGRMAQQFADAFKLRKD
jgi:hypothetical protein